MIDDIMKERTPEAKPRFFLHDEVKAWLADNLQVNIQLTPNHSTHWGLQNRIQNYGIYSPLVAGFALESRIMVAGETIQLQGSNISMAHHLDVIQKLLEKIDMTEAQIQHLNASNEHLVRRIELLENPLPV